MADELKKPQENKATETTPSKLKKTDKPAEGTVVEFSDKMWIEGTGNSKHFPKGKKQEVNRTHGEHLINKGVAKESSAPPKVVPKPVTKKKDDEEEDD